MIYPYQAGASGSFAITNSIDSQLAAPYTENFDLTIGREMNHGFFLQVSYVGRYSKHSLLQRDMAMPTQLTDPSSGQNYYQAMTLLMQDIDFKGYTPATIPAIPFFNNMWNTAGINGLTPTQVWANDYINNSATGDATNTLNNADNAANCSERRPHQAQPANGSVSKIACGEVWSVDGLQPAVLGAFRMGSIGKGNYNALRGNSLRKRLSTGLQFDLNYTWSKSIDLGSAQENTASFSGFVQNTWNPSQMRAVSNYDTTQQINVLGVYELPFGRGKRFGIAA